MSFTQGHALVIGIGEYQYATELNASVTAGDAARIAAVLAAPEYCAYPPAQIQQLIGPASTRGAIIAALKQLATTTTVQDTVLVFYSGHGLYSADGHFQLSSYDTQLDGRGLAIVGTGIAERELLRLLRRIPAARMVLIFNACHAGAINPRVLGISAGTESANPSLKLNDAMLGTGEGRVIITACRDDQKSYFVPGQPQSVFGDVLARTLCGEGVLTNRDYITVLQLYDALYEQVEQQVQTTWKVAQQPELTVSKGVGAMPIAHYAVRPSAVLGLEDGPTRPRHHRKARSVDRATSAAALAALLGDGPDDL